jgi:cation diffusion facilitator family transporter
MLYHSFESLFHPAKDIFFLSFIIAVLSLIWKYGLYVYTIGIGEKENSKALIATANDHLADVYASIAATIGIGLGIIGEYYGIEWLMYGDPVAGIVVSFFVLKLAYEMGTESIHILMERNVEDEKMEGFKESILTIADVKRIDRIRAREHGHYILIDVRLSIPGEYTIQQGHDICREIKKTVMDRHEDVDEVLIHLNPWYKE